MKSTKRSRIIVALDDQVLSQVAASILRNQDFDLIGVHFSIDLTRIGLDQEDYPSALRKQDIAKIEKFCAAIDIPLRIVDVTEEVFATVYDPFWMATLTGAPTSPALDWVSGFLIPRLAALSKEFRAEWYATGHLVRKLEETPCGLLRYTDPMLDQSASFSRLKSLELLDHLLLPLGNVSFERIIRLAHEMNLIEKDMEIDQILNQRADHAKWKFTNELLQNPVVQSRAPAGYFKPLSVPRDNEVWRAFIQDLHVNVPPSSVVRDLKVTVQAVNGGDAALGSVTLFPGFLADLRLKEPLAGLASGSWLVFYDGERVIGSGKVAEIRPYSATEIPIEKAVEAE